MFEVVERMEYINRQLNKLEEFSRSEFFIYILIFSTLLISSGVRYIEDYRFLGLIKNMVIIIIPCMLIAITIKRKKLKEYVSGVNLIFFLIVLFALISSIWSQSVVDTMKNSIFLGCTTIIAIYISLNYEKEDIFKVLFIWFLSIVAINFVTFIFRIGNIYDVQEVRYDSVIRGIFKHRNLLGFYMTLAISFSVWFLLYNCDNKKIKYICISEIIIASILLYMSKSMTSILLLIGMLILIIVTKYKKINKIIIYGFIPLLLLSVYIIIYQPQWYIDLLALIGRSPNLTDRDVIWRGAIAGVETKPLLGYGYSGYWTNNIYSVNFVAKFYGGLPNHAHNGYLDVLLDFGFIGSTLIVSAFGITIRKIKRLNSIDKMEYINFILAYIVFICFYNLIESPLVRHLSTIYILFIIFFNIVEMSYKKESLKNDK